MKNLTIEELDKLINDESWIVRHEVARQGYGLDKLINDSYWEIRLEVARQGYGLDKLINDSDNLVRLEVAKKGYGLDKLINDVDNFIRREVARQGYGLDKLINDNSRIVRREVTRQGYGLDKLINDIEFDVSDMAKKLSKFQNHKVIAKNFGTYEGILYLHYNNENDYLIVSGCYETNNIDEWIVKCSERLNLEIAFEYSNKINELLNN